MKIKKMPKYLLVLAMPAFVLLFLMASASEVKAEAKTADAAAVSEEKAVSAADAKVPAVTETKPAPVAVKIPTMNDRDLYDNRSLIEKGILGLQRGAGAVTESISKSVKKTGDASPSVQNMKNDASPSPPIQDDQTKNVDQPTLDSTENPGDLSLQPENAASTEPPVEKKVKEVKWTLENGPCLWHQSNKDRVLDISLSRLDGTSGQNYQVEMKGEGVVKGSVNLDSLSIYLVVKNDSHQFVKMMKDLFGISELYTILERDFGMITYKNVSPESLLFFMQVARFGSVINKIVLNPATPDAINRDQSILKLCQ
ncbi:MAG: hypothetical protein HQL67_06515 [Magnetococcales bacterium]|nr:hypothetical protein [Magnetococcales bacterium]